MEPNEQRSTEDPEDTLAATELDVLPSRAISAGNSWRRFKYVYTTGPFQLPADSGSLDWVVLNNDPIAQTIRVTVFKCGLNTPKTALPPGSLELTVDAGATTHNANTYPQGFIYEIQVESNSRLVFPYMSVWPGNFGVTIPGASISAASFVRRMA